MDLFIILLIIAGCVVFPPLAFIVAALIIAEAITSRSRW